VASARAPVSGPAACVRGRRGIRQGRQPLRIDGGLAAGVGITGPAAELAEPAAGVLRRLGAATMTGAVRISSGPGGVPVAAVAARLGAEVTG